MTVQKALIGINVMIRYEQSIVKILNENIAQWTKVDEKPDVVTKMALLMKRECDYTLPVLLAIRKQLKPNSKCKHPKKFQDVDPNKVRYCTCCNTDL